MKFIGALLVLGTFLFSSHAHAQTGAEYTGSLGIGAGLANHLGKSLTPKVDSAVSTISFSGDPDAAAPQTAPQTLPPSDSVRRPSSN